jgi:hypothetical protein
MPPVMMRTNIERPWTSRAGVEECREDIPGQCGHTSNAAHERQRDLATFHNIKTSAPESSCFRSGSKQRTVPAEEVLDLTSVGDSSYRAFMLFAPHPFLNCMNNRGIKSRLLGKPLAGIEPVLR